MTVQYLYIAICMYYYMSFSKLNSGIRKKEGNRNKKRRRNLRAFRWDTFRHPVSRTSVWRETANLFICASFTCLRKLHPISGGTRYVCHIRNLDLKRWNDGRTDGKSCCSSWYFYPSDSPWDWCRKMLNFLVNLLVYLKRLSDDVNLLKHPRKSQKINFQCRIPTK